MDAMAEIRQTFFEECDEQLVALEAGLSALENGSGNKETIGVVFRAVHSVKGGAASFNLKELVRFALTYEGVLNEVRSDRLALTPETLSLLRRAAVLLTGLVAVSRDIDPLLAQLRSHIPGAEEEARKAEAGDDEEGGGPTEEFVPDLGFTPVSVDLDDILVGGEHTWRIVFKPRPELYANANESARLIRECLSLGTGTVVCDTADTPMLDALEPEGAFLSWTLDLTTEAGKGAIAEIFEFAEFDCDLEITMLDQETPDPASSLDDAMDPELAALFARLQAAE